MSVDTLKIELINIVQSYQKLSIEQEALLQQLQLLLETKNQDWLIKSLQTTSSKPETMFEKLKCLETLNNDSLKALDEIKKTLWLKRLSDY